MAACKGKTRTLVAVGHRILVRVYHRLNTTRPSDELGADSLDRVTADPLTRDFLKCLEQLGVQVTVQNQEHVSTLPTSTAIFEGEPARLLGYPRVFDTLITPQNFDISLNK